MDDQKPGTNVEYAGFAPFVNPVAAAASIMPDRFTSTSAPLPASLVSPDLGSVSAPQAVSQRADGIG